jgi:hypothetical protein
VLNQLEKSELERRPEKVSPVSPRHVKRKNLP